MKPGEDGVPEDRAALYVLGLLEEAEAEALAREAEADQAVAAEIAQWRARLADLDMVAPELNPGEALWQRIEAALPAAAPSRKPRRSHSGLWHSLPLWRGVGLAATAAAILLAVGLTRQMSLPPAEPVMIAVLVPDDGTAPGAVVEVGEDGTARLIPLEDIPVPAGRALQVWTKWSEERGPVSIGLMDAPRSIRLETEGLPPPQPDQLYEITLEPETGSPTGVPTGPILMKGLTAPTL